jgi:tRNA nucleotidyltransferase/poly(A) polymerase
MVLRGDGTIYDPYGGKLDIHAKQIKTVGMPKDRIQEDPLRMLRAARFAARYGFKIDPNFIGKARHLADRIFDVSVERWVQELDKLLTSKEAYFGVDQLHNMEVLQRMLPELYTPESEHYPESHINPFDCCGEIKVYDNPDKAWKFLLSNVNSNAKVAKFMNSGICQRFKFSNDRTDFILDKQKKKN